jgi:hypothetical protein
MRNEERVRTLGEVFTPEQTAVEMLDLIEDVNYASRYLEPGCGSGNFLTLILQQKLDMVLSLSEVKQAVKFKDWDELEIKALIALSSIYGVDIDAKNILESKQRLFDEFLAWYSKNSKQRLRPDYEKSIYYILASNIIIGDLMNPGNNLVVMEYTELPFHKIQRRLYRFQDLIFPVDEVFEDNDMLFGHVPNPIEIYPAVPFRELGEK